MAVTKKNKNRADSLTALTAMALSLPGVGNSDGLDSWFEDFPLHSPKAEYQYMHYEEGGNRMEANVHHSAVSLGIFDRLNASVAYNVDIYSGATPSYSVPDNVADVITSATGTAFATVTGLISNRFKDITNEAFEEARNGGASIEEAAAIARSLAIANMDELLNQPVSTNFRTLEIFAYQPLERRRDVNLSFEYELDEQLTYTLSGGHSQEADYESTFVYANANYEFNDKLSTVTAGFGYILDDIGSVIDANLNEKKDDQIYRLGLSHILNKNSVFSLETSFRRSSGFLSNPYKTVYIRGLITAEEYFSGLVDRGVMTAEDALEQLDTQGLTLAGVDLFFERRPKKRSQWVFAPKLVQYVPQFDAALHLGYRYYTDNWNIDSNTFEVKWFQPFSGGWLISPRFRYYSQSKAKFFSPFFLESREDGNYSSDFRLSGYGTISTGMQVEKSIIDQVSINAGAEWTTHKGSLKLGGNGLTNSSYADIDYFTVTAGINIKF
ncbi:MAG: DUF3570 domain-containing protein [Gammaproteobacteria bacterium]|nr:DUF3570 domain-containing protein [Gammaproteobacteria bacterium]